ncbi:hypothetical protein MW887_001751 [Aspergillus wentii]|nr:hypothetical protein MW887_001751 [Aspergillus wentii]
MADSMPGAPSLEPAPAKSSDNDAPLTGLVPKFFPFAFPSRSFQTSGHLRSQPPPVEHGVHPCSQPLSAAEINAIFGRGRFSPEAGNRIIAVLQGRRLAGTLDLDLPDDITHSARQPAINAALKWLRANHPLDEDAAILARIDKEYYEEEQKLIRRAENLGLYKPQSGSYGAERGESNDPFGKSVLQEAREKNEARLLEEQEQKRREWLEGEELDRERQQQQIQNTAVQKFEEAPTLEVRERADPSQRPVLAWVQKHYIKGTDYDIDLEKMTTARRILPTLGVTLLTLVLCYAFALNYEPPTQRGRMWPDTPPAAATAMAIIGINLGIYALWKVPPAWRMLNRYFINAPLYPHALGVVGSVFSQQTFSHLAANMLVLWFIGTRLHDEIGRGNFLPLYMAAGVFGSMTSMVAHVMMGRLMVTSLGASGAMSGLVSAWCMLKPDDRLTVFFLPREWQEIISVRGSVFLTGIVAFELFNLVSPFRVARVDHWAHLGGYLVGAIWATAYNEEREKKRREEMTWFEKLVSE